MPEFEDHIQPVKIEEELSRSYLDYAMSVIVGRALPDVRDGLKPVHRRVLFAMNELRNTYNRPYVKSARVVGEVIGKYHPHGDSAVYDAIVRMAQDFSMRVPLVDGQGNFGSVDGDLPAAQRYTEVRMTRFADALLADLDKGTVPFVANYDDTLQMPEVLPNRAPHLLINGSSGIAVGMATNIPPHNVHEVVSACLTLLENPEATVDDLMAHIQGPDFPTGAIINGHAGILNAYRTGRGSILIRSKAEVVTDSRDRESILVHEIPYQVNKAEMIAKIANLVREKKMEGISDIRDESDKEGLRVVIEVKRTESAEIVLNNLYAKTDLEKSYGINLVALVENRPRQLNLKELLEAFLTHRRQVVTRRTQYLLAQEKTRAHVLEGQVVALVNIDQIVETIKQSSDIASAKEALMAVGWPAKTMAEWLSRAEAALCRPDDLTGRFGYQDGAYYLSDQQTQSILELRLHRLTSLEQDKLRAEHSESVEKILDYRSILGDDAKLVSVIRGELQEVIEFYVDGRRTAIMENQQDLDYEDLIDPEGRVITISHKGYAKARSLSDYQVISRGGRGRQIMAARKEDFVQRMFVANTHTTILCFSNIGKVYWLKVYRIPLQGRLARGRPLINLLSLQSDERITAFLPVDEYLGDHFIFMATAKGQVKKTPLKQFERQRSSGLIALSLKEGDMLIQAAITDGSRDIILVSSAGKAIRFNESEARAMGRTAAGVRGMRVPEGHRIVSMIVPEEEQDLLLVSERGYGKRTNWRHFSTRHRGGRGIIAMQTPPRNGFLVSAVPVSSEEEVVLVSERGRLVRIPVTEISLQGRSTQGVRLARLNEDDHLIGAAPLLADEEEDKKEGTEH